MQQKLPEMGSHIMMDFHSIDQEKFNLSNPAQFQEFIEEGLKLTDCNVCDKKATVFDNNRGMTLMYLLSESHISVHTFPESSCMTIDFYNCGENSWKNLISMEEHLFSIFGWENCSSSIMIPRGKKAKFLNMENEQDIQATMSHNIPRVEAKATEKDLPLSDKQFDLRNTVVS
ncbi:S-adenosylmethionine decarboxylase, core [Pseudocohnilembus persalinus]|uniref:S-adenosylmethionine decarboxylase, core n=1 Tax=Pseudocohnilembus persalinus TaxID=266149 RepID=A0A0V0QL51_PSEPJ|nr:S-adenosylmethionine decarboxylase, core [Pseudocohnilembus persalinus]|eukprot:KRX02962.1 S-adenosylmethionine decarboxylase, core [Pseudocohnilembus persalinus]